MSGESRIGIRFPGVSVYVSQRDRIVNRVFQPPRTSESEQPPFQLRHTAATTIRSRFGLEASQVVLGHAKADVTRLYDERDLARAHAVMAEIG